jgi:precorrin-3B methylase
MIIKDSFDPKAGRLDVLGLGPGDPMWIAPVAHDSLATSDVIIGYKTYIDLIRPILGPEKEVMATSMRQRETVIITTLSDLAGQDIDMQTTIIVGNSQTFVRQGRMITPRGYVIP